MADNNDKHVIDNNENKNNEGQSQEVYHSTESDKKFIKFILSSILLLLIAYPLLEYSSILTSNHVLEVVLVFDDSQETSAAEDIIHCLYNGGFLKLSYESCESAFARMHGTIGVSKYGARGNGQFRYYDVILNFIGDYGWKLQHAGSKRYIFTKTKFRLFPDSF